MASQADVRRIALSLPETEEAQDRFAFSVRTKGKPKGFVWVWMERLAPKKPRVPQPDVIAVRVANQDAKDSLLASDPREVLHRAALRRISRSPRKPAGYKRLRAQAAHHRGVALPSPEGSGLEEETANETHKQLDFLDMPHRARTRKTFLSPNPPAGQ